ncbi:MAG TPA: trypsin-like peptidase domain-containing protein, partial [Ktedonobacterales bacterium]|nr:trypsin-like peptidase domain-containing protein [Ktedonobacterales bacterium]
MSDGTLDPSSPNSSVPSTNATAPARRNRSQPTTPPRSPQTSQPQRTGGLLGTHPVLAILAVLVVIAVALGIGFSAGRGTAPVDLQQTTISTISAVDPSVVQVQGRGGASGGSVGSGEILTSSGYIVTNSHVVHGFSSFAVLLSTGQTVSAQLAGDVPSQDLAVLKISASNLKPIAVGDSSQVQVGEYDIAMGSPLGLEQSATAGIISALNREGREVVDGNVYTLKGLIQTSAPINPGNSGGALVNLQGQLIGIPTLAAVDPSTGVAANGIG